MSQFQFYENCTFCQSRIGSIHCLLPYQLLKSYNPPEDVTSKIVDVTEIHMIYGIESLNYNLEVINRVKSRPYSGQGSVQSTTSHCERSDWFEQMNESVDSQALKTASSASTLDDVQSISYSDYITEQLELPIDEGVSISEDFKSQTETEQFLSFPAAQLGNEEKLTSNEVNENPLDSFSESVKRESVIDKANAATMRNFRNHAVRDLVIIAKAAYNIHANGRGGIRTNAFKESLMNESNIRCITGQRYQPSTNTLLDGNKALAKELIAYHSTEEIQCWESGRVTESGQFCILNARALSQPIDKSDDSKLGEDLVKCFFKMLLSQSRENSARDTYKSLIQFELERCGHEKTFDWIDNRYLFLEKGKVHSKAFASSSNFRASETKSPEPKVKPEQRVIDFMNTHLQVFINRKIESFGDNAPVMPDETKLPKFLYKLASEFILRNKGWHNENSFANPQHLVRLEEQTGLKSRQSESLLTFNMLKAILDDFRASYKQRFPKTLQGNFNLKGKGKSNDQI